jgi:hypothetical protein
MGGHVARMKKSDCQRHLKTTVGTLPFTSETRWVIGKILFSLAQEITNFSSSRNEINASPIIASSINRKQRLLNLLHSIQISEGSASLRADTNRKSFISCCGMVLVWVPIAPTVNSSEMQSWMCEPSMHKWKRDTENICFIPQSDCHRVPLLQITKFISALSTTF